MSLRATGREAARSVHRPRATSGATVLLLELPFAPQRCADVTKQRPRESIETHHLRGSGLARCALGHEERWKAFPVDADAPALLVHRVEPNCARSSSERVRRHCHRGNLITCAIEGAPHDRDRPRMLPLYSRPLRCALGRDSRRRLRPVTAAHRMDGRLERARLHGLVETQIGAGRVRRCAGAGDQDGHRGALLEAQP